ncbi:MAG: hypothetical protein GX601_15700 [Anaerolineales bacterium]|nr:hypothetical protein [Anaerolineales bacterium]
MRTNQPLILITNDDGIASHGLRAAVQAARPLGEILVVAPARQLSGSGRGIWADPQGAIRRYPLVVDGQSVTAYEVGASPALVVLHGIIELAPRQPALVISGINFGENVGADVTGSGTVGAALQAAACGVPCLASSLQTPKEHHKTNSHEVDFAAAVHFTRLFARSILDCTLPADVDLLKMDIPADATPQTPWRFTRVSKYPYYETPPASRRRLADGLLPAEGAPAGLDYDAMTAPEQTEPDSDIYALRVDRVVSVAPLSLDLSSRVNLAELHALLEAIAQAPHEPKA